MRLRLAIVPPFQGFLLRSSSWYAGVTPFNCQHIDFIQMAVYAARKQLAATVELAHVTRFLATA
jgi:hypothetical protein